MEDYFDQDDAVLIKDTRPEYFYQGEPGLNPWRRWRWAERLERQLERHWRTRRRFDGPVWTKQPVDNLSFCSPSVIRMQRAKP